MKQETRNCQNCKKDFVIEPDDFGFYEKIKVPPPTFCPECRNQRRMSWRNERSLHKIDCKAPGHSEKIISMYGDNDQYTIFDNEYWWSDKWDHMSYGLEYDFSIPFFSQFSKLLKIMPLPALSTMNSVNSQYTNFVDGNKNCYLIFAAGWNENVQYGNKVFQSKESQDLFMCTKCQLSYQCENCVDSYKLIYCSKSKDCTDSYLLYNCKNCSNCFGCINLVSKSYCIWNKQYSREDYFKELKNLGVEKYSNMELLRERFMKEMYYVYPHKYANIIASHNCTGDNINNCKNCIKCFEVYGGGENSKYLYSSLYIKDSYDGNGTFKNELSYECVDCNVDTKNRFSITLYESNDVQYTFNCHDLKNCFGCVGLRKKQYCILNKQYTKEQYEELIPKIIEQMNVLPYVDNKNRVYKYGEFFPSELSPFLYNETIAHEHFPLSKEEIIQKGFYWRDPEARDYAIEITNEEIPDTIEETDESIIGKVIECKHKGTCNEQCTEAFKLIPEEYSFYKRMNIPIPHLCPNCRHYERFKQVNPTKLYNRSCMCQQLNHSNHSGNCSQEFETTYSPEKLEILYCEKCYHQEVY